MTSNFEYYKIFYYVAKYGNLTRAASALNTSQPAVTRVIHKLEADLGCRLFIRSKSGMELTAEGSRFFEYVSAGCLQFFRAESHLSDLLQLENGSISISATETALHSWLFEAMENFHEEYPGVHFQILNHSTQDSIQAVRDGKVDFAVVSSLPLHISEPLRMKKLHTYRDILISGKRFSELKGHPVSLRELASYPWISLTSESISRTFLNTYFAQYGLSFSPDMELATTDLILPAVRHNLGIGFIPEAFAHSELAAGNIFQIQVQEQFPERNILLISDSEYPQSVASKAFQKFAKEISPV